MKGFFDGLKTAFESLSDADYRKSLFSDLKEGISEDVKTLFETKQEAVINGLCPSCAKETGFRECSFAEETKTIGKFIAGSAGQFATSNTFKKAEMVTKVVGLGDDRSFPNYVCLDCQAHVMQCSGCQKILPYSDLAESHVCQRVSANTKTNNISNSIKTETAEPEAAGMVPDNSFDSIMSKLERLGNLKERGLLSAEEFEFQKKKLFE